MKICDDLIIRIGRMREREKKIATLLGAGFDLPAVSAKTQFMWLLNRATIYIIEAWEEHSCFRNERACVNNIASH